MQYTLDRRRVSGHAWFQRDPVLVAVLKVRYSSTVEKVAPLLRSSV